MDDEADPFSGLTRNEQHCLGYLVGAHSLFVEGIPRQHPDEVRDWTDAMHTLQRLIGMRIARREYPHYWGKDKNDIDHIQPRPLTNAHP